MKLYPKDLLVLACLLAAIASMLLALRGEPVMAAWGFLAAYLADGAHESWSAGVRTSPLGVELCNVTAFVAFAFAPATVVVASLSARAGLAWALAIASAVLVAGALRMALQSLDTTSSRGQRLGQGLSRAQMSLGAVGLASSSVLDAASGPVLVAAGTLMFALFALAPWGFVRPFAQVRGPQGLALVLAAVCVAAGALWGRLGDGLLACALASAWPHALDARSSVEAGRSA